jgi:hypothetical protein
MFCRHAFPMLLLVAACTDRSTSPTPQLPTGPTPVLMRVVWNRNVLLPDALVADGDSLLIRRSFPQDSCCFTLLVPSLSAQDSVIRLDLVSPSSPTVAFPHTLTLETVLRRGAAGSVRFIQNLRYPGTQPYSDTVALPPVPADMGLPALQISSSLVLAPYAPPPDTLTSLIVADGVAHLEGSIVTGGWTPIFRATFEPELTDSMLTLHLRDQGFPFPSVSRIAFATSLTGLPPGLTRLRLEYRGRQLDTLVAMPPNAP